MKKSILILLMAVAAACGSSGDKGSGFGRQGRRDDVILRGNQLELRAGLGRWGRHGDDDRGKARHDAPVSARHHTPGAGHHHEHAGRRVRHDEPVWGRQRHDRHHLEHTGDGTAPQPGATTTTAPGSVPGPYPGSNCREVHDPEKGTYYECKG